MQEQLDFKIFEFKIYLRKGLLLLEKIPSNHIILEPTEQ